MTIGQHIMTPGDVARALGVSPSRVQQLDDVLEPIRLQNGHRRYDPAVVQRYLQQPKRGGR